MNYNKLTKAEIIKAAEEKDAELERLRNKEIHNEEEFKDMERLKKENSLFLKGTREKDASIAKLQEQINASAEQQAEVFQRVEDEANQKIATVAQQTQAIATEYEFVKGGLRDFMEVVDELLELTDLQAKISKQTITRMKKQYVQED